MNFPNDKTSGLGSYDKNWKRIGNWRFLDTTGKVRTLLNYDSYKKLKKRYISDLGYSFNLIIAFDSKGKQIGKNGKGYFYEFDTFGNESKKIFVNNNSVDSLYLYKSNKLLEIIVINKGSYPSEKTTLLNYENGQKKYQLIKARDTTFEKEWFQNGTIKSVSQQYKRGKYNLNELISYYESGTVKRKSSTDTISTIDMITNKPTIKLFESSIEFDENGNNK